VTADRCHHANEEKNLFHRMESRGVPRQQGPLAVMPVEHELGLA
jgi:hemerythrin-like domain-containing protein